MRRLRRRLLKEEQQIKRVQMLKVMARSSKKVKFPKKIIQIKKNIKKRVSKAIVQELYKLSEKKQTLSRTQIVRIINKI